MQAVLHGDVAGAGVTHAQRNGEWMDPVPAVVEEFPIANFFGKPAAPVTESCAILSARSFQLR